MRAFALLLAALAAAGCDASLTDPNVARIEAITVGRALGADADRIVVQLSAPSAAPVRTASTEVGAGPFPLTLRLPAAFGVETTDGLFGGEALLLDILRCDDTDCADRTVLGGARIEPGAWRGRERTVDVGETPLRLSFRKTTS